MIKSLLAILFFRTIQICVTAKHSKLLKQNEIGMMYFYYITIVYKVERDERYLPYNELGRWLCRHFQLETPLNFHKPITKKLYNVDRAMNLTSLDSFTFMGIDLCILQTQTSERNVNKITSQPEHNPQSILISHERA